MSRRIAQDDAPISTETPVDVQPAPVGKALGAETAPRDALTQNRALAEALLEQQEAGELATPEAAESPAEYLQDQAETARRVAARERELLKQEAQLQRRQREEISRAQLEHRRPRPITASPFDARPDPSLVMDDDGKPAGQPGTHKRIARLVEAGGSDGNFRQSRRRVGELQNWGYRIVKSRVTDKPIVNEFGVLMECPPEAEGERKAFHGRRLVSERDVDEARLHQIIEDHNREEGTEAVRFYRDDHEHTAGSGYGPRRGR